MELKELAQWIAEKPEREIRFGFSDSRRAVDVRIREGSHHFGFSVSIRNIEFGNADILGLEVKSGILRIQRAIEANSGKTASDQQ